MILQFPNTIYIKYKSRATNREELNFFFHSAHGMNNEKKNFISKRFFVIFSTCLQII